MATHYSANQVSLFIHWVSDLCNSQLVWQYHNVASYDQHFACLNCEFERTTRRKIQVGTQAGQATLHSYQVQLAELATKTKLVALYLKSMTLNFGPVILQQNFWNERNENKCVKKKFLSAKKKCFIHIMLLTNRKSKRYIHF